MTKVTEENPNDTKELLLKIGAAQDLFHDDEGVAYVTLTQKTKLRTLKVNSRDFREWLQGQAYISYKITAGSYLLDEVIQTLSAQAKFVSKQKSTYRRVAGTLEEIFIDLGNEASEIVRVTSEGVSIEFNSQHKLPFLSSNGYMQLTRPLATGDIALLRQYINCKNERQWKLLVAWLVSSLMPTGPYPILILGGEQGSGKTSMSKMLTQLIDPAKTALRTSPKSAHDLMISAQNGWLLSFDNLSGVNKDISDTLCVISTGGCYTTRALYSDDDEKVIEVQRPMLLNGIDDIANRGDLADRSLIFRLPTIDAKDRTVLSELQKAFNNDLPSILAGLYQAVSAALCGLPNVELDSLPRMANYAKIGTALESFMGWESGSFMKAYYENIQEAAYASIENSVFMPSIIRVLFKGEFEGSATELLGKLNAENPEGYKSKMWPKDASSLSFHLNRLAPVMRKAGMVYEASRTKTGSLITMDIGTCTLFEGDGGDGDDGDLLASEVFC
jgi:hypothetical protein